MVFKRIIAAAVLLSALLGPGGAAPAPDSAGMVEMVNGLAYGGIPYGSVSGMLANYAPASQGTAYYPYNSVQQAAAASVLVPVTRTAVASVNPVVY